MDKAHFIAIGGQSMSGIAKLLLRKGFEVSGSDIRASGLTDDLLSLGAKVFIGHDEKNLDKVDFVVVSSAIQGDNPELRLAKRLGIPVIHRMDMLLKAIEGKNILAVAGSHGKTSTTSMLAYALKKAGAEPTFLLGGEIPGLGNFGQGAGPAAVIETDESDGSFLKTWADVALVTNIDDDHLDYWGDIQSLEKGFFQFLNQAQTKIVCGDDCRLRKYSETVRDALTYGFEEGCAWQARNCSSQGWGSSCEIFCEGKDMGALKLAVPGLHNLQNALGALVALKVAGISLEDALSHLSSYPGVKRRLEKKGEAGGIFFLDDFAHHPKEILASLSAVKKALPEKRILLVYQPHRYSRTRLLKDEFGKCFKDADILVITGIYAGPGEGVEEGSTPQLISDAVEKSGHKNARCISDKEEAFRYLVSQARPGDVIMTMGAGDVYKGEKYMKDILQKGK